MSEEQPDYKTRYFEVKEQLIHERYLDVLKRLEGGTIYGVPVTADNVESLVVAAYFAGQADVQKDAAGLQQLPL